MTDDRQEGCTQCKLDEYHRINDPEFLRFQQERRLERNSSWCTCKICKQTEEGKK